MMNLQQSRKLLVTLILLSAFQFSAFGAEPEQLSFGIYPYDTPSQIYQGFEPLLKYLSSELGIPVKIVIAPNYMAHIINIGEGRVDLGFMGPSPYIKAADKYGGVELIARLVMKDNKNDRLVIISYKDSGVGSIRELKGKTFAFGDFQSFGSHFYPRYLLHRNNVKLKDLKSYDFLGSHSRVVLAVAHRDFDAGGVREDIYDKYRDRPIRVIAGPFTMPPHVIVCRKDLSKEIKAKIEKILSNVREENILHSIDPALKGFGSVKDADFRQAREVVDFVEER